MLADDRAQRAAGRTRDGAGPARELGAAGAPSAQSHAAKSGKTAAATTNEKCGARSSAGETAKRRDRESPTEWREPSACFRAAAECESESEPSTLLVHSAATAEKIQRPVAAGEAAGHRQLQPAEPHATGTTSGNAAARGDMEQADPGTEDSHSKRCATKVETDAAGPAAGDPATAASVAKHARVRPESAAERSGVHERHERGRQSDSERSEPPARWRGAGSAGRVKLGPEVLMTTHRKGSKKASPHFELFIGQIGRG